VAADAEVAMGTVLELSVPLRSLHAGPGVPLHFQFSFWKGGLPLGTLPHEGWIELRAADSVEWEP
jgi:hypothetical protein